jgi:site-specific DNA-methyltransferase (adenine-specific)
VNVNKIICGRFEDMAHTIDEHSVDLVVTSPPYANQREALYGGIDELDYPAWTVGWMSHVKRLLKPTGNVVINIRPHVTEGQISDYMLHTRLALRADDWRECDEWIWYKPDAPPLGNPYRPRRAWESLHWFALHKNSFCDPKANGTPSHKIGFTAKKGLGQQFAGNSKNQDGIARVTDFVIIAGIYEVDRSEKNTHPAQYPETLVNHVIATLCPRGGLILDPFVGGGTTAIAALKSGRQYVGFDKEADYVAIAERRIKECEAAMADPAIFTNMPF